NPVNPTEKSLCRVERVQMLVRLDEGVLGGIDRGVVAAEHPEREIEQRPLVAGDKRFEGRRLARQALLDQRVVIFNLHIHRIPREVGKLTSDRVTLMPRPADVAWFLAIEQAETASGEMLLRLSGRLGKAAADRVAEAVQTAVRSGKRFILLDLS